MDSRAGGNGDDDQVASNAEQHLVAAMLQFPGASLHIGRLSPDEFYNPRHRVAFEAILALQERSEPVDVMTLSAEIHRRGMLEPVGGLAGLASYLALAPTGDNAGYYAGIVRERSFVRRLGVATDSTTSRLRAGSDWRGELSTLKTTLEELEDESHQDPPTLCDVMQAEVDSVLAGEEVDTGLPTGLGIERVCPMGIPLDKVTTIFGETGTYKTTVASNIAWNMAASGHSVVCISWEDSNQLAAQRALGRTNNISYGKLAARKLDDRDRMLLTIPPHDAATAQRVIMVDNCEPAIEAVIRTARYYKRTRGARAVFVDYLQLLDGQGTQKQVLDDAIQRCQRSARVDQIAYVLVSQVKAEVTNRANQDGGPRPTLDDCLGSSAMRIGTKLGLGVYRPWKYCRVPSKGASSEYYALAQGWPEGAQVFIKDVYPKLLEVLVTKNVVGEAPAVLHCLVDPPTGRIVPFEAHRG